MPHKYVVWFEEVSKEDTATVGGKGANLGEMIQAGIPIPYGFIVTVSAYKEFLSYNKLDKQISQHLKTVDYRDSRSLDEVSKRIKKIIIEAPVSKEIASIIIKYYLELPKRAEGRYKKTSSLRSIFNIHPLVAVRSSATAEDLPEASFAGQQATYLNVKGEATLIDFVKKAWASLYEPRAIFYRHDLKIEQDKVAIAIPVQLMVNSSASGVMFTVDPISTDKNKLVIEAIFGLGEYIVQGTATPDHFEIDKQTDKIIDKKISTQEKMLVKKGDKNVEVLLKGSQGNKPKITDRVAIDIAKLGKKIEKHYFFPQDIEWAIESEIIYIVQSRPITTLKRQHEILHKKEMLDRPNAISLPILAKGDPASPGIAQGPAKIIKTSREIHKIKDGDILVAPQTDPDFVPAMRKAAAIVTERGGRTSHAAIVSRELGIPAIVGVENAIKKIAANTIITVNGKSGEIFKGALTKTPGPAFLQFAAAEGIQTHTSLKTATKIYVNLAEPDRAKEVASMDADGVGLLRAEFMIANIGIHPKKLLRDKKRNVFVHMLAEDLHKFCKAFHPRPIVYRATDFKSNEYGNLKGGHDFEPVETNPMLGYRGAFRYIHDPEVFDMEIDAIKRVRNKYDYKNLHVMIPFVRTVKELIDIKKHLSERGLSRGPNFKLWMMVEIPSNVILIDKFCQVGIDGVSIGSNDLTMLILGTDRDNSEVAPEFDERNDAVLWALEKVIKTSHKYKITSSICGQAASDYPDLVEKLIAWGITSVSVNPDALVHTREIVYNAERRLVKRKD
ncbi:phosphoenolpyruvate synthase [Candidatus Gottesmanbacteria bacterium]|nr:phosphoenolpyruvate synthase [Candidatus Gottesmanbacteria bacterium]